MAKDRTAERRWRDLCASHGSNCQAAYDQLAVDPYWTEGRRWTTLGGKFSGIRQHEVGGGARIWFTIDERLRVVVIDPYPAHPKQTE